MPAFNLVLATDPQNWLRQGSRGRQRESWALAVDDCFLGPKKMRFGLTESLSSLVKAKFDVAKSNGSLLFSWTDLAIVRANGVPVRTTSVFPTFSSIEIDSLAVSASILPSAVQEAKLGEGAIAGGSTYEHSHAQEA